MIAVAMVFVMICSVVTFVSMVWLNRSSKRFLEAMEALERRSRR